MNQGAAAASQKPAEPAYRSVFRKRRLESVSEVVGGDLIGKGLSSILLLGCLFFALLSFFFRHLHLCRR